MDNFNRFNFRYLEDWADIFQYKRPIIMDTSFLLASFEGKLFFPDSIDQVIDQAYQMIVLTSVIREVKHLQKNQQTINGVLTLIEKFSLVIDENQIESTRSEVVDVQILQVGIFLKRYSPIIATGDHEIQKRSRRLGLPILTVKNKRISIHS